MPVPCGARRVKKAFEAEKQATTALRTHRYPKVREGRTPIKKHRSTASLPEATPLAVLDDSATGIMTALTTDGLQPFPDATVQATAMLDEIEASLAGLAKKGVSQPTMCPASGASSGHGGAASHLGRATGADQTQTRLAPGG